MFRMGSWHHNVSVLGPYCLSIDSVSRLTVSHLGSVSTSSLYTSHSRTTTQHQAIIMFSCSLTVAWYEMVCRWIQSRLKSLLSAIAHETDGRFSQHSPPGLRSVSLVSSVQSLGVMIDDMLSFNKHVDIVCNSCNFHIGALRHIRRYISEDTAKTIACLMMVHGRLDYCNSVLNRMSSSNINKLQRVQNSVARINTRRWVSDHITPVLADLHWLLVQY